MMGLNCIFCKNCLSIGRLEKVNLIGIYFVKFHLELEKYHFRFDFEVILLLFLCLALELVYFSVLFYM